MNGLVSTIDIRPQINNRGLLFAWAFACDLTYGEGQSRTNYQCSSCNHSRKETT